MFRKLTFVLFLSLIFFVDFSYARRLIGAPQERLERADAAIKAQYLIQNSLKVSNPTSEDGVRWQYTIFEFKVKGILKNEEGYPQIGSVVYVISETEENGKDIMQPHQFIEGQDYGLLLKNTTAASLFTFVSGVYSLQDEILFSEPAEELK